MDHMRRKTDGPALLQAALAARNLNQVSAAKVSGVPQPCISRYLAGKSTPGPQQMILLQVCFGIPPAAWAHPRERWDNPKQAGGAGSSTGGR